ncbi:MAG: TIGR03364 family FAD-dependent oxidoreductase [Burkholderiales bacterium]|nr:TIGR03364 family FAD-dependent oxidoreductase [Burkholderiales bacterium]
MTAARHRVAIVGAGIVGLAHAWAAALRGDDVAVYEKDAQANGASVRNFGLGLVLGQAPGELLTLAQESRQLWLEFLTASGCWHKAKGSLVVARSQAELDVLEAFQEACSQLYGTALLSAADVAEHQLKGLGALRSPNEIAVDARQAIATLALWLQKQYGVQFHYGVQVKDIALPYIETNRGGRTADEVVICSGHDFQTLYPTHFAALGIRRCALQMQRVANPGICLDPALMTGLSTLHYGAFTQCAALEAPLQALRREVQEQAPALLEHGIHLIVQQVGKQGELIIGDSHVVADTLPPFNRADVDALILELAEDVLQKPLQVTERWQGIYASGRRPFEIVHPAASVQAIAITSGIGMSIAFALARRNLSR